jgi:hypothetical protein
LRASVGFILPTTARFRHVILGVGYIGEIIMPYHVRAFCTSPNVPKLAQVFEYAESQGVGLSPDESHGKTDVNTSDWTEVEILCKTDKSPLVAECNRDDGSDDCLARVEPQEFVEEIGKPGLSFSKRRVINHLKATKFIIAVQLLNDIDDDGYEANGTFLNYFVEHCGGMIHADGEGFYDGNKLIIEIG